MENMKYKHIGIMKRHLAAEIHQCQVLQLTKKPFHWLIGHHPGLFMVQYKRMPSWYPMLLVNGVK